MIPHQHTLISRSEYEKPEYSDLTIELSDGYEIPAHRIILCRRNEYFNALFGSKSQFAVSMYVNQAVFKNAADVPTTRRKPSKKKSSLKKMTRKPSKQSFKASTASD